MSNVATDRRSVFTACATAVVTAVILLSSCHADPRPASSLPARNAFGDPYVTDSQARLVKRGMSAKQAFLILRGRAVSGSTGEQALPPRSYLYPVRGTGDADDFDDDSTFWWEVCVADGRVTGVHRGHLAGMDQC